MKTLRAQFTVGRLLVIMGVYSLLFAIVAALPAAQMAAAVLVTTAFVIVDLGCSSTPPANVPRRSRVAVIVSHYATAFALSTVACCGVYLYSLAHAPPPPARPPVPVSQLHQALGDGIGEAVKLVVIVMLYALAGTAFGIVGWLAALISVRHYRRSVVLLIANTPWLLLVAYVLIGVCLEWI